MDYVCMCIGDWEWELQLVDRYDSVLDYIA